MALAQMQLKTSQWKSAASWRAPVTSMLYIPCCRARWGPGTETVGSRGRLERDQKVTVDKVGREPNMIAAMNYVT